MRFIPAPGRFGFTLLEMVLGISLASGLLLAVFAIHHQAEQIRQGVEAELDTIAAARLFLDRITFELQAAARDRGFDMDLDGRHHSIEFLTTTMPPPSAWAETSWVSSLTFAPNPAHDRRIDPPLIRVLIGEIKSRAELAPSVRRNSRKKPYSWVRMIFW